MKKLFIVSGLAVLAGAAFSQELVVNGGFETSTVSNPPVGWTGVQGGTSGVNDVFGPAATAHSGLNLYGMGATGVASQTDLFQDITTTIGSTYKASFWAMDNDPNLTGHLLTSFGTVQIGPSLSVPNVWTQYSINLTATTALTRLEFTGWEVTDSVLVDDFSVQKVTTPEPASIAGLGLGALALIRRRRSKKA
jgi:hypothetical protein